MSYALTDADPEAAWDILAASGYVALWTPPEHVDGARARYLGFWERADPRKDFCLVMRKDGVPVGTIAATHNGKHTWMMHQLACLPRQSETLVRDEVRDLFIEVHAEMLSRNTCKRVVAYMERHKSLNKRLYVDFVEQGASPHAPSTWISYADVFRRSTSVPLPPTSPIPPFNPIDLRIGDEDGHLFGLMNMCWSQLTCQMSQRETYLRWIVEHFRSIGKHHVIVLDTARDGLPQWLGFEFVSEGMRWSLAAESIPAWLDHLRRLSETKR